MFVKTAAFVFAWLTFHPLQASDDSAQNDDLTEVVKQAYREVHDGWSTDEVLLRDTLNEAFIRRCRRSLPEVDEAQLNWTLLNLRKAGRLEVKATKRASLRHDDYFHAAEIAARFMYDKYRTSTDRVMCDPERRTEFDAVAQAAAPGVAAYRLRKAAFSLRKARKLRPELVARVAEWDRQIISLSVKKILSDPDIVPTNPGVYIFRDATGYLYIGESANLRTRVSKHVDRSDRKSLAHYLWKNGTQDVTVELHAFDPESSAQRKEMRRAYESELIRSRKPRFNIAP
jgi:predicted GIY-YIG superfamily endonuclease